MKANSDPRRGAPACFTLIEPVVIAIVAILRHPAVMLFTFSFRAFRERIRLIRIPLVIASLLTLRIAYANPALSVFSTYHPEYVFESDGRVVIQVDRSGETNLIATVEYVTVEGTAQAGLHFQPVSGALQFAPGESRKTFEVPVFDNALVDGEKTVHVSLRNPLRGILGERASELVRIRDNEYPVQVDPTFRASHDGYVSAAAIQPDGRVLIRGSFTNVSGVRRCKIARLNADGSLDETFEAQCIAELAGDGFFDLPWSLSRPLVAVQPDGKILTSWSNIDGADTKEGILRFNADGSLDNSFRYDTGGGALHQLEFLPNGKALVLVDPHQLIALNADGSGNWQFYEHGFPQSQDAMAVAVQADGKILVAIPGRTPTDDRPGILRLNLDGSLDRTLSVRSGFSWIRLILPGQDGKIVIGGMSESVNGNSSSKIARLNPDGAFDASFKPPEELNGTIDFFVGTPHFIQPDGKVLISRFSDISPVSPLRINPDGSIDPTFSAPARSFFSGSVNLLGLQADGKVVASYHRVLRLFGTALQTNAFTLSSDGDFGEPELQGPHDGWAGTVQRCR